MSGVGPSRVRPTASSRRSRRVSPSNIPEIEEVEVDIEEEVSEELTGLFPGGPYDISILRSFKTHIATNIWKQKVIFFLNNNSFLKCLENFL